MAFTAQPKALDCPHLSELNGSLVALPLYSSLLWVDEGAFNHLTSGVGQPSEQRAALLTLNNAIFDIYGRPVTGRGTPDNLGYDATLQPYGPEKVRHWLEEAG